jgi:predicted ATPase
VLPLARALKFAWLRRTHRGFFFRAEDFFRFARHVHEMRKELEEMKEEYAERYKDRPQAYSLTVGAMAGQAAAMDKRYDGDLHERSHGESFLKFFQSRFVPDGLYLMDEPEAALSPQRQLALLSLMHEMVGQGGQFIIATHAPILMAYPGAALFDLDTPPLQQVDYDDLEHVSLTRAFLNDPKRFLRHLAQETTE